jgi:hypothetical protein
LAGQSDEIASHLPSAAFGVPSKPGVALAGLGLPASHELLSGQPWSIATHWLKSAFGL